MTQTETLELLVATLQQANSSQSESIERLTRQNEQLQNKLQELLAQVAWLNRQLFGRKSEKLAHLDPNQLSLFDPPVQPLEHEIPEEAAAQEPVCSTTPKKKVRQNRNMLDGLPVVEIVIEPEGVDPDKYKRIGEERTRTLEFEPGKLYVKEIIRPKYGLKDNISLPQGHQGSVIIAPLPLLPIYKGLPGASLLTEILLQKYEYHVPFYRQVREFHHLGLKISENTLQGWFKPACELLKPLYEELKKQVLKADYIQVDETTLPVINKQNHKAVKEYLWIVRAVMDGLVFFHYDDGSHQEIFQGEKRLITVKTVSYTGWKIVSVVPMSAFNMGLYGTRMFVIMLMALSMLMIIIINQLVSARIAKPLQRLNESVKEIKIQAEWDRDNEWNYCLYQFHNDECSENITK